VKRTLFAHTAAALMLSLVFAVAAFGEGGWQSHIAGWYPGQDSREWWDGNTDARPTHVRFVRCTTWGGHATHATIELRRVIDTWPDDFMGNRQSNCQNEDTVGWGRVQSGHYRFRLNKVGTCSSGCGQLWVDFVGVAY
jgi:hypothetical protein